MPDPNGFLRYERQLPKRRPVPVRIQDWREVYPPAGEELIRDQATRCMDCGIPFCHEGCPLGNRIPDWNDLVRTGAWAAAAESLHATNNFPEFTGRLCPAPCEAACVLGIGDDPVTIKQVEVEIANHAFDLGYVHAAAGRRRRSGKRVAVVGSGPAGLAAAQQLARAGHAVTVYERDDRIGGLLRYGIPDFKIEKEHIDVRLAQMAAEGVVFATGVNVGVDVTADDLRERYDAVLLACGALAGRDTPDTPGRHARRRAPGDGAPGARPTGWSPACRTRRRSTPTASTSSSSAAATPAPTASASPTGRARPAWSSSTSTRCRPRSAPASCTRGRPGRSSCATTRRTRRAASASSASPCRSSSTTAHGNVAADPRRRRHRRTRSTAARTVTVTEGSERDLPRRPGAAGDRLRRHRAAAAARPVRRDPQPPRRASTPATTGRPTSTGVFVAGDMHRGASLIVWAIAEGRAAAAAIHDYLGGTASCRPRYARRRSRWPPPPDLADRKITVDAA